MALDNKISKNPPVKIIDDVKYEYLDLIVLPLDAVFCQ